MTDIATLLTNVQHAQQALTEANQNLTIALDALASAHRADPTEVNARISKADDERLFDLIASKPPQVWRHTRTEFGSGQRADDARNRLLVAERLRYEKLATVDAHNRIVYRAMLVVVEREKAPEGAPTPRRILPPGF